MGNSLAQYLLKWNILFFCLILGNVMTLKFLSDASVTAGGFRIKYIALDPPKKSEGKNTTQDNYLAGRFGIIWRQQHWHERNNLPLLSYQRHFSHSSFAEPTPWIHLMTPIVVWIFSRLFQLPHPAPWNPLFWYICFQPFFLMHLCFQGPCHCVQITYLPASRLHGNSHFELYETIVSLSQNFMKKHLCTDPVITKLSLMHYWDF